MLDGIEREMLDKILEVSLAVSGIVQVSDIRARWLGHRIHAEVTVSVDPALTVDQAHDLADTVEHDLKESMSVLSGASIHTHPARPKA